MTNSYKIKKNFLKILWQGEGGRSENPIFLWTSFMISAIAFYYFKPKELTKTHKISKKSISKSILNEISNSAIYFTRARRIHSVIKKIQRNFFSDY